MKETKKKENILVRFFNWIIKGNKKAAEKGDLCQS